ncbi:hypothetical protein Pcinc_012854 [Petrolisthes cinctipes]|uniref:Myb-like domain-containing protein n=1 Tax=Petrolisthes cinctipes TaxID=88211 RepID=A0AAE1KUW7_PETCI|nr:hypothetical protein Pcinc_012854 [Petrolisthes cinctipes]
MAWETIATKLQQAFPAGKRTVKECQKRWQTILTSSRPKLAKVNGDFTATGGGPPHPPLDPLDELVADILGKDNVSIKGIVEAPGLHTNRPEESSISVCLGADEDEASGWDGLAAAGTANGSTSVLLPADDSAVQAAAGSTSRVPVYPEQHAETLYLMDEGELQHQQKRRQLELTLLEEKIKAQRAITLAMRLIAQVCEKIME